MANGDLDGDLKLGAAAALASSGYYCKINVSLSALAGEALADVTDVDVLAVRHDITFAPRMVAVSCKSGGSLSVSKELFYLRGVLDYLDGDEGVVLLSKKAVAPQLRDLGRRLDLLCLQGAEIDAWMTATARGTADLGYFGSDGYAVYNDAVAPHGGSVGLQTYLKTDYWFHRDFRNIQNVIAHLKKAPKMTGNRVEDSVRFFDVAAHFALSLIDLCRHVQLAGVDRANTTISSYLFGGDANLKARRDLYHKLRELLARTGVVQPGDSSLPPLVPAYSHALHEVVVRFLDRPQAAVLVPQAIQNAMWKCLGATGWKGRTQEEELVLASQKLADDLIDFLRAAAERPWAPLVLPRSGDKGS